MDGLAASYPLALGGGFKLDLAGYAGGWDKLEPVPGTDLAAKARSEGGLGATHWLRHAGARPALRRRRQPLHRARRPAASQHKRRLEDLAPLRGRRLHPLGPARRPLAARHPLTLSGIAYPRSTPAAAILELGSALTPKLWLHVQGEYQTGDFERPAHPRT